MTAGWKSAAILAALSVVVPCATAGPPACTAGGGSGPVQAPVLVRNLDGQTGWYAVMVLEGAHGTGERSARRKPGWEVLPRDGEPELLLTTYGDPGVHDSGRLMVLSEGGAVLHDLPLPDPSHNGNGNGAPAAPTVGDLDGDGQLEVLAQTFDHGLDVFTVPGSGTGCLLWPTARGGPLRMGQPNGAWMLTEIFADGFEAGAAARWSAVVP